MTRRVAQIVLLCCAVTLLMGADNENARFHRLGGKIMCTCGSCTYRLLECNHVGCPNSTQMIAQLHRSIQQQTDDEKVLDWFRGEWGVTAVIEPRRSGFELLAWILPFAALGVGLLLVVLVVRLWRARHQHSATAAPLDPHLEALRSRARQETEI